MTKFKKTMKKIGRQIWELFKGAFPSALMYFCAGTILLMLTMKEDALAWDGKKLAWTIVCILGGAGYNALVTYAQGGNAYEMLVSGNMKRTSEFTKGGEIKISSHKYAKEYRPWKGFAMGAMIALWTVLAGIICAANQTAITNQDMSKGVAILLILCFLLSGWSILPMYYMNLNGVYVSYYWSLPFALLPIIVTGVMYIVGAYGKRNKDIRAQELADRAAAVEQAKVKKINYGGLPGTKPRKRK